MKTALKSVPPLPAGVFDILKSPHKPEIQHWIVSPTFFAAVADNARQRDTIRHALKAIGYLKNPLLPHDAVNAALLPNGALVKLDGHTRSYLWERGSIPVPEKLSMTVYDCATIEQTHLLYSTFDSQQAVETAADQCSGGARQHELRFESDYCKGAQFSTALSAVSPPKMTPHEKVGLWKRELLALDKIGVNRKRLPQSFISAYLVAKRLHEQSSEVDMFFSRINEGGGVKDEKGHDAVDALAVWYDLNRQNVGNGNSQKDARNVILGVFEAWWKNRNIRFKRSADVRRKATCFVEFCKRHQATLLP